MSVVVQNISLEPFNTFAVPAQARFYAEVSTPEDIRSVLADHRYGSLPRFVLGGGSNTLFTKDFDGLVLRMTGGLIDLVDENDGFYFVRVGAGVVWDDFVRLALEKNWYGLENLAAIPGTVGGAAVQNIGAYGVEVAERIVEVECFDPDRRAIRVLSAEDCDYGYRTSLFKTEEKNLIVTSVLFALPKVFEPVCSYKELEAHFAGKSPESARELEEAVRAVRARKLPDPKVLPNAGSFFKNPIVTRTKMLALLEETPSLVSYPLGGARTKLAAGWLIEACGLKGERMGAAGVYENQALVLVNHGGATGAEIKALADEVTKRVKYRFDVQLETEPVII